MSDRIRISVKAIIEKAGCNPCSFVSMGKRGTTSLFQAVAKKTETVTQALSRECREVIGADVEVRDLRFVHQYILRIHEFAEFDSTTHQVEFSLTCDLPNGSLAVNGPSMVPGQISVEWIQLDQVAFLAVYPQSLRDERFGLSRTHCGDTN